MSGRGRILVELALLANKKRKESQLQNVVLNDVNVSLPDKENLQSVLTGCEVLNTETIFESLTVPTENQEFPPVSVQTSSLPTDIQELDLVACNYIDILNVNILNQDVETDNVDQHQLPMHEVFTIIPAESDYAIIDYYKEDNILINTDNNIEFSGVINLNITSNTNYNTVSPYESSEEQVGMLDISGDISDEDYIPNLSDSESTSDNALDNPASHIVASNSKTNAECILVSNSKMDETSAIQASDTNTLDLNNTVNDDGINSSRKRTRKPKSWARNVKKSKVNCGRSYTSSKGKTIRQKFVQPPCETTCRLKCTKKINSDQRKAIFDAYWAMGDITRQRNFIANNMVKSEPSRNRGKISNRAGNFQYHFVVNNNKLNVCKLFFLHTLDISSVMITTLLRKTDDKGVIDSDKRGKHGKQKVLPEDIRSGIRRHISSFARVESHYCRADTTREYIDGSLDITQMYRLYIDFCKDNEHIYAKKHVYETIFNTEYNIGFFQPKKDQCQQCIQFLNAEETNKQSLKEAYELHHIEKQLSRKEKDNDSSFASNNKDTIVCCYDLQAVLSLPAGQVSVFFYKRKLNVFNFTIYDIAKKDGFCYLWHEGIAARGANEIGSCVLSFLRDNCQGKHVIFYSDNWVGQNKNKFISSMYLYCTNYLNVLSITHKYLIVGHTQNEGDSMHSTIERQKKKALKSGPLYLPSQLATIAQVAKKTGTPYKVKELNTSDFVDLKALTNEVGKNFKINEEGEKVIWNNIKVLKFLSESPDLIFYKNTYQPGDFKVINVRRKQRGQRCSIGVLKAAYKSPPEIPFLKKRDLLSLCDANLIPSVYHGFFRELKVSEKSDRAEDHSDESDC